MGQIISLLFKTEADAKKAFVLMQNTGDFTKMRNYGKQVRGVHCKEKSSWDIVERLAHYSGWPGNCIIER